MNVTDALVKEIERNRELLKMYQEVPTGAFGAMMINADIQRAVEALASGDGVEIVKVYEAIKDNE